MGRVLIYDPYLDTLGGGERYVLTLALSLLNRGLEVEIAWNSQIDLDKASLRFGLNLSELKLNPKAFDIFSRRSGLIDRFNLTNRYDIVFWASDGSLPFLFGKNNLVHFQVPFTRLGGNPAINMLKLFFINKLVYNSQFTRNVIERSLPRSKGFVLYPPIATKEFLPGKKENVILSVARFDSPSHLKRQDVLIDAFDEFSSKVDGFRLILAGGHKGNQQILDDLKEKAKRLPVEIIPNPSFNELQQLYSKAKFFWHATGFGIDETREPEKAEHFGMTTVEAMSAGAVPIVIGKGGQKEIVTSEVGFLCSDAREIALNTIELFKNPNKLKKMSKNAVIRSKIYSTENFYEKIRKSLS